MTFDDFSPASMKRDKKRRPIILTLTETIHRVYFCVIKMISMSSKKLKKLYLFENISFL